MGKQMPVTSCMIVCNGQGPIVSSEPGCLDFGDIQVLQERIAHFRMINDSPIPAQFKLTSVSIPPVSFFGQNNGLILRL